MKLFTKVRMHNDGIFYKSAIEFFEKYNIPSNTLTDGPIK